MRTSESCTGCAEDGYFFMVPTAEQMSALSPPGPRGLEVFQALQAYRRDSVGCLLALRRQYGEVVHLRMPADARVMRALRPLVGELPSELFLLNHPEHIHALFHNKREHFAKFVQADPGHWADPLLGDSLQVRSGAAWKERQTLLFPLFRPAALAPLVNLLEPALRDWLSRWRKTPSRDLVADVRALVLQCAVSYLFGAIPDATRVQLLASLEQIHHFLNETQAVLPVPLWVPTAQNRHFKTALQQVRRVVTELCRQRREERSTSPDLLSRLALLVQADGSPALSEQQILYELNSMFLAGHITTSLTLLSTLRFIVSAPAVQDRLAETLGAQLSGPLPSVDVLDRLEFCEQVWRESLRLNPPAGVLSRRVTAEVELSPLKAGARWCHALRLPTDASVLIAPWVVHRDPAYFPQPESYLPERWTAELRRTLPTYAFFPFGGGERACTGQGLTRLVILSVLSTLFRNFRVEAASPNAWGDTLSSAARLRQFPVLTMPRV